MEIVAFFFLVAKAIVLILTPLLVAISAIAAMFLLWVVRVIARAIKRAASAAIDSRSPPPQRMIRRTPQRPSTPPPAAPSAYPAFTDEDYKVQLCKRLGVQPMPHLPLSYYQGLVNNAQSKCVRYESENIFDSHRKSVELYNLRQAAERAVTAYPPARPAQTDETIEIEVIHTPDGTKTYRQGVKRRTFYEP